MIHFALKYNLIGSIRSIVPQEKTEKHSKITSFKNSLLEYFQLLIIFLSFVRNRCPKYYIPIMNISFGSNELGMKFTHVPIYFQSTGQVSYQPTKTDYLHYVVI